MNTRSIREDTDNTCRECGLASLQMQFCQSGLSSGFSAEMSSCSILLILEKNSWYVEYSSGWIIFQKVTTSCLCLCKSALFCLLWAAAGVGGCGRDPCYKTTSGRAHRATLLLVMQSLPFLSVVNHAVWKECACLWKGCYAWSSHSRKDPESVSATGERTLDSSLKIGCL